MHLRKHSNTAIPRIGIVDYKTMGNGYVHLLAKIPSGFDKQDLGIEIAKVTSNSATPVKGTFVRDGDNIRVLLKPVTKVRSQIDTAHMQPMGNDLYSDGAQHLWKLTGEGSTRQLIRQGETDIASILKLRKNRMSSIKIGTPNVKQGDYASALVNDQVITGFVTPRRDGRIDLFTSPKQSTVIDKSDIIESVATANWNNDQLANASIREDYIRYLEMVHRSPEYIQAWRDALGL